jgi:hypothetical protein
VRNSVPFGTVVVTDIPNSQNPTNSRPDRGAQPPLDVEVCLLKLLFASGEKAVMAQNTDSDGFVAALAPDVLSPDRTPDEVAIFSTLALGVVSHWWIESNRRWTARNGPNTPILDRVVPHGGGHALSVDSDRD